MTKANYPVNRFRELETPFYYYDLEVLRRTLAEINANTSENFEVHYAMKANVNSSVLACIKEAGLGADCVSGGEVQAALNAGIPASKVVFAGVGKADWEINLGLENDIFCFNVESIPELEVIDELAAAKDGITAIKIKSGRMLLAHGFMRKVFEIFESYQTSIDMITTSEVGVSITIDNTKRLDEIVNNLKKLGTVTTDSNMVIICVVGDLPAENVGFQAKAVAAMKDIPVRMISYGGSNYNISFLIKAEDKKRALIALSEGLFN